MVIISYTSKQSNIYHNHHTDGGQVLRKLQKKTFINMAKRAPFIHEGDKVMLNISRITSRKDYHRMQAGYKKFIEESGEKIYTAHCVRPKSDGFSVLIELKENPKWLFVQDDLLKI